MPTIDVLDTIIREVDGGRRAALCAIVATRGSTPQPAGAMVCVDEAAKVTGTLGGGCVEADVRRRAYQLLCAGKSELLTFTLDHDFGLDDGMICGGDMDVAVSVISQPEQALAIRQAAERLRAAQDAMVPLRVRTPQGLVEYRILVEAPPKLVIAGGGHIAKVLAGIAVPLGFRVSVIDDRPEFANAERFAPPIDPVVGDIAGTLRRWPIDANTYVVIVTRGHQHDEQALAAVLDSPAKYVGMIGSRRKIEVVFDDLREAGAKAERLDRVHAPIGVDIHAVTTDEIALSIAAELVCVRRAGRGDAVQGPIPIAGGAR